MASMKLYLQTLSRHQVSMDEQSDFYRFMLEDLERLDRLINQMLEAGRLEAERSSEEIEDVDLPHSAEQLRGFGMLELSCARRNGLPEPGALFGPCPADGYGSHLPKLDRQCRKVRRKSAACGSTEHIPARMIRCSFK